MTSELVEPGQQVLQIFIVDDHPLVQFGLTELISQQPDMSVCGTAGDVDDALQAIVNIQPDLVIVDISLKNSSGIDLIKRLNSRRPRFAILVSSMHDPALYADRVLRAGAGGYVQKQQSVDKLVDSIRAVLRGETPIIPDVRQNLVMDTSDSDKPTAVDRLSDRELQVFELLGQGNSSREIAEHLHLSIKTIETHREHIKKKLQLKNSSELVRYAVEWVIESRR